jgi:surfeit locus 1 family protein
MTDGDFRPPSSFNQDWEPKVEHREAKPQTAGFPIGLTLATAIGLAILISLGVWQLHRLAWKENLLAHVAALQSAKAQGLEWTLDNKLAKGADVDLTRVSVVCPGLATAPFLEVYDLRDGQTGQRLISACRIDSANYGVILVDRGFVADTLRDRPAVDPSDRTPIEIEGVLRTPERGNFVTPKNTPAQWYRREPGPMAQALGVSRPAPVILFAETSTNPQLKALDPAPLPVEIPNRHFEYALTWFALAGALAFVYAATLFKRIKG